jgi:hypothetical protein
MSNDDSTRRRRFLQVAGSAGLAAVAGCSSIGGSGDQPTDEPTPDDEMTDEPTPTDDGMMEEVTLTLRVENVAPTDFYGSDTATGGQIWITPGAYAVHTGDNPIFTAGEPASVGLEAVAEAGPPTGFPGQPGLVDELPEVDRVSSVGAFTPSDTVEDPNDPMGAVPGAPPIAPGGAFEVEMTASPGQRLSFATMYVPSNDLFLAPESAIQLWPEDGEPVQGDVTDAVGLFDAGTELNGQPGVDTTGAPAQGGNGGPTIGATEGVVHPADMVNDAYRYADPSEVIRVTVSPQ